VDRAEAAEAAAVPVPNGAGAAAGGPVHVVHAAHADAVAVPDKKLNTFNTITAIGKMEICIN
jgi:hypothetical protein